MKTTWKASPEVKEWAVRLLRNHRNQYDSKIDGPVFHLGQDELYVRDAAVLGAIRGTDRAQRGGVTTSERERINTMEREVRELRQASEILREASAFLLKGCLISPSNDESVYRSVPSGLRSRVDL